MCNRNRFLLGLAKMTLFLVIACHQNRIVYGCSKLARTDDDTCNERKGYTLIIRDCHIYINRKLDNRQKYKRQGDGFEYLIEQGQFVKEGTPLIKFDREKIKKAGYRDVTICVISETGNAKNITFETGTTATANKTQVASWEN